VYVWLIRPKGDAAVDAQQVARLAVDPQHKQQEAIFAAALEHTAVGELQLRWWARVVVLANTAGVHSVMLKPAAMARDKCGEQPKQSAGIHGQGQVLSSSLNNQPASMARVHGQGQVSRAA
jgi:hypothetical protein